MPWQAVGLALWALLTAFALIATAESAHAARKKPAVVKLSMAAPARARSGAAFDVTVTALTSKGKAAKSYRGKVKLTSSHPSATLPAAYTFKASDNGGTYSSD